MSKHTIKSTLKFRKSDEHRALGIAGLIFFLKRCGSKRRRIRYDEAITTPTAESLRRAMAIQMIVNQESGWTKCENPSAVLLRGHRSIHFCGKVWLLQSEE